MKARFLMLLALLLAVMALVLAACGPAEPADTTTAPAGDATTTAAPTATTTEATTTAATTTTAPLVSTNPITEVKKMKSGNLRMTHADGSTTTINAALPMSDGYNSVYFTSYGFDADGKVLTLELVDTSYENTANKHLGTANATVVCITELGGKLVWRYEADTEWKPLCNAGKDADPLTALVSATEIGKVTIPTDGKVALTVNGNALRFRAMDWKEGTDFVMDCSLFASSNKQFNIAAYREVSSTTPLSSTTGGTTWKSTGDDITPINIQGTYIGANHGYYIIAAIPNPASDPKTEEDVGSVWKVGNQEYVLVRAGVTAKEDSHATEYLWFCPISDAMMASGSFSYKEIPAGSQIEHVSGATNTRTVVPTVGSRQIQYYNAINHVTERAFLNGNVEIDLTKNAIYTAEYIDFYESYDIIYLPAMLEYLMENVGYNDNMTHCSDEITESYVTFHNTYRFHKNGALVVYSSYDFHKTVTCSYIGGVQSGAFSESDHYIYVPGANNEYKKPTLQGTSTVNFGRDDLADPDTLFTSYFQMTSATGTKAMNLGFNPDFGFGKNEVREAYIQGNDGSNLAFYYTSYKMYPRLVANCQITAGTVVDCIAYRLPSEPTDEDFTAINWYWVGDEIYLSLHTTKTLTDKVVSLPDYMEGMTISAVENSDSFSVSSTAVENGTITVSSTDAGYTIIKLSPAQ